MYEFRSKRKSFFIHFHAFLLMLSCSPSYQSIQCNPCGLLKAFPNFLKICLPHVKCAHYKWPKLLVCPSNTQPISLFSGHSVSPLKLWIFRTEIRQHLLHIMTNCTTSIFLTLWCRSQKIYSKCNNTFCQTPTSQTSSSMVRCVV
jgi:hypothetical protein